MGPPGCRLGASRRNLAPLRQGDLDGLCGLYAIINAVQLGIYPRPLRRAERRTLFATGLDELERRQALRFAVAGGMHNRLWLHVCRRVIEVAVMITGEPLVMVRPQPGSIGSTVQAIGWIRRHTHRGTPVLAELQGRLGHWTVVAQVTDARLVFFDSAGHRWIDLRGVDLVRGRRQPRHGIFSTGLVAVRRSHRFSAATSLVDMPGETS